MGFMDIFQRRGRPHSGLLDDLSGKVAVVTGANTGVGFATCARLAKQGATVYFACRSQGKALEAMDRIAGTVPGAQLQFLELDLADLNSVVKAARELSRCVTSVDILINNAGIFLEDYAESAQGIELVFAVNHLGHFVFTGLIKPLLSPSARVVNVSSSGHGWSYREGLLPAAKLRGPEAQPAFRNYLAYGQSKLANILFTKSLAKILPGALSTAVHPGIVKTDIARYIKPTFWNRLLKVIIGLFQIPATEDAGAYTQLYAALANDVKSGSYYIPFGKESTAKGCTPELEERLWRVSMDLIKDTMGNELVGELSLNFKWGG